MDIVTKETFKIKLQKLVEHFSDNESYYKSSQYKEDELRQEFINPFFKALGWDMNNEQGSAPQYREVIHEDRLEIEGNPKAPDYAFKLGSDRKFFVEAKASSVRIFSEIDPAFQLRRYAWSGQLPVSILTDFEEFSVYDTTIEPNHTDKSSVARIKYINYKDYLKEIDYLWNTFSREAVWKGSFDKFVKSEKRGSQLVDKSFLKEIELWRDLIAKDIASNNNLNIYELNSVVQKLIDRIIFLRIAEDRGVETYETLRGAVKSSGTYSELLKIFRRADDKYNSSLFDLKKDELSAKIKVSDKTLDRILNNLYYPKSPYEFSEMGVDILGSVYEQFLGKVIRLTKVGNAVIEEKPEVKKAGGVYYTPQYIVDYIVKNTVGELVEGKTPKDVTKLKVVDPACGSGSFLIGAYNYLLNWHHKYYVENDVEKNLKAKRLFKDSDGNYFLSTQENKEILINNIHGVDIDPQAVEVTKLSLALKMLEGENSETINAQYKLFADRILPDLSSNIKCGNSLIGSDYYSDKQISLLSDEELRKVNAFDWNKEFPLVFRYGGFDAVIGNPPYIRIQRIDHEDADYIYREYKTPTSKSDLSIVFIEKGISLISLKGLIGFISTSQWVSTDYGKNLRGILSREGNLFKMVDFGSLPVFEYAQTYPAIFLLSKRHHKNIDYVKIVKKEDLNLASISRVIPKEIPLQNLSDLPWNLSDFDLLEYLNKNDLKYESLSKYGKAYIGALTGRDESFVVTNLEIEKYQLEKGILLPYAYRGAEIYKFIQVKPKSYIIYPYRDSDGESELLSEKEFSENYPKTYTYLLKDKSKLMERKDSRQTYAGNTNWFRYLRQGNFNYIKAEKLIFKGVAKNMEVGTLSPNNAFNGANCPAIIFDKYSNISPSAFLGILNSKLISFFLRQIVPAKLNNYRRFNARNISQIPIIPKSNVNENKYQKLEQIVTQIIALSKDSSEGSKYKISVLEESMNDIIYDLYNLGSKEKDLVESSEL